MFSKTLLAGMAMVCALSAQTLSRKIELGKDAPVAVVASDWNDSSATPRGGAYVLDINAKLSLRNTVQRKIRSVTLAVTAQEVTPGGRGSVSVPSLDVAPGETFPVSINLRLLRPLAAGGSPGVEVVLDGVLFDDLNFYGPNRLNSRRTMTVWELEARRDRKYFRALLDKSGPDGLQKEVLSALARQADRQQSGVQMVRGGRATTVDPEREMKFAFLKLPDAPIEPTAGLARVAGNEARAPRLDVLNRSDRPVRYLEIGWLVRDLSGREFMAGSMPAELDLPPGKSGQVVQDATLKFTGGAGVSAMTGFVSSVEFADGSYWIPSRTALSEDRLWRTVAPSPEEQRLLSIYRKRGLSGLVEELKKF